jgi:hypothetical protein
MNVMSRVPGEKGRTLQRGNIPALTSPLSVVSGLGILMLWLCLAPGRRIKVALAVLSLGMLSPTAAMADSNHGVLCHPEAPYVSTVDYSTFGVANRSPERAAVVHCGGGTASGTPSKVKVIVYDRHPTQDVCCLVELTGGHGEISFSTTLCSTGASESRQRLLTDIPRGGFLHLACTIPPAVPGGLAGGLSHVTTYSTER